MPSAESRANASRLDDARFNRHDRTHVGRAGRRVWIGGIALFDRELRLEIRGSPIRAFGCASGLEHGARIARSLSPSRGFTVNVKTSRRKKKYVNRRVQGRILGRIANDWGVSHFALWH